MAIIGLLAANTIGYYFSSFKGPISIIGLTMLMVTIMYFIKHPTEADRETRYYVLCLKVLECFKNEILEGSGNDSLNNIYD